MHKFVCLNIKVFFISLRRFGAMGKFNQLLKTYRKAKGPGVGDFAEKLGMHRNTLTNYEADRDAPIDFLIKFAHALQINFADLMRRRIEYSDCSEEAKNHALASLNSSEQTVHPDNPGETLLVQEESHSRFEIGQQVLIQDYTAKLKPTHYYAFINPMTKSLYAAKAALTDHSLTIIFDNPAREDIHFTIEGETDVAITLRVLGFKGRITKTFIEL